MSVNYKDFMDRLKTKLEVTSDAQLAKLLGFSAPALVERNRRESIPYDAVVDICRKRGISIDYLVTGNAEEFSGHVIYECERSDVDEETMMIIPYFKDIRCAVGAGCTNDDNGISNISYIVLPRDGYPELSNSGRHLHAFTAHGDSMEGNIYDGAIVLVDFGDKGYESGRIYVVSAGDEVMVKRLFIDPSDPEKLILQSDNIYYPKFTLDRNEVSVDGRVFLVYNRAKLV